VHTGAPGLGCAPGPVVSPASSYRQPRRIAQPRCIDRCLTLTLNHAQHKLWSKPIKRPLVCRETGQSCAKCASRLSLAPVSVSGTSTPPDFYSRGLQHWLRKQCKRGKDCDFLHEINTDKMPPCRFFDVWGTHALRRSSLLRGAARPGLIQRHDRGVQQFGMHVPAYPA
jgi:hypothetical protein